MTRKIKNPDDESEEDIPSFPLEKSDNPWLGGQSSESSRPSKEVISGYRKLWDNVNKSKEIKKNMVKGVEKDIDDLAERESVGSKSHDIEEEFSEVLDEGLVRKSTVEDYQGILEHTETKRTTHKKKSKQRPAEKKDSKTTNGQEETKTVKDIDPYKFLSMADSVIINSSIPVTEEGDDEDEDEQRRMTLAEAFADDDVVEQFREEKEQVISASIPKDIDLTLPGWGEWGGSGLKISKRKKRQFIIKAPSVAKRRDEFQGNLIINQDKNPSMRRQQVRVQVFLSQGRKYILILSLIPGG